MKKWAKDLWERIKESVTWLSVQVLAVWGVLWVVYSQLPADVIVELTQIKWLGLSLVAWAGIIQSTTIYMARVKKAN